MIIDAHAHVAPHKEDLGARQDASVETFLAEFDASPLDRVILLPIEPYISTEFAAQAASHRPRKIFILGSVDPHRGTEAVRRFDWMRTELQVRGLKLHPRRQRIDMNLLPVLQELTSCAARYDLPVLIDSFPYGKTVTTDSTLELIAALGERVPEAKIIIAHMGGLRVLEALNVARTNYTMFFDISLIYSVYRGSHIEQDIFYAIRRLGADRCLYGSDYPDAGLTQAYEDMRKALDQRGFGGADLDQIFGKTAAELFCVA
jgi:uncharacterized protein